MNYTQITIEGRKIGLKFGMMCMRLLGEKMETKNLMNGENLNELGIAYVLFYAYLNNCEAKEVDPEFSFEQFLDYVEEQALSEGEEVKGALGVWANSAAFKKSVEIAEEKKMLIGTEC